MPLKMLKPALKEAKGKTAKPIAVTNRVSGYTWMQIRRKVLLDNPLCVTCQDEGRITPAKEVDHIIPLWKGGDSTGHQNLQGLCIEHHLDKSRAEAKERASGGV